MHCGTFHCWQWFGLLIPFLYSTRLARLARLSLCRLFHPFRGCVTFSGIATQIPSYSVHSSDGNTCVTQCTYSIGANLIKWWHWHLHKLPLSETLSDDDQEGRMSERGGRLVSPSKGIMRPHIPFNGINSLANMVSCAHHSNYHRFVVLVKLLHDSLFQINLICWSCDRRIQ